LFFRGLFIVMAVTADKFFLHVTPVEKSLHVERRPFFPAVLDQLRPLVGDRSGQCADDNFANKGWPVCAVINDRWFRGAFVVLAERSRDPAGPPLQGDTFLDGLTADECDEATRWISGPPGRRIQWPTPRNRVRF
jgi:hypothetical protein